MRNGDHVSEKNAVYLTIDQPKAGRFYLLPKIHKAGNPGRPIVSANGHQQKKYQNLLTCIFSPMYRIHHLTCRILQTSWESKMQWVHFHLKLFLFRWMSHPSTQIFHMKMVSKHVRIRIRIVYWWNAETTITHQDLALTREVNFVTQSSASSADEIRESGRAFPSLIVWGKKLPL